MRERSFISNSKVICEVIVFLLLLFSAYEIINDKYAYAANQNVVNAYTKSRYDGFYELEENTLDMVFIGSSHSYCTFDPENFDSVLGSSSWQMGTPLQHYDTSYYSLKEVLKTQSPDVIVLEIYWGVLDTDFDMKQANSFFEVVNDENVVSDYVKTVFPLNERVKYTILPIRYQQDYFAYENNNLEKTAEEKYGVKKYKEVQDTNGVEYYLAKGYTFCDTIIPENEFDETNQFKGLDGATWQASQIQIEYIEMFVELCNENDIEVVFVTAPIANVSMDYIENYDVIHDEMSRLAERLGVKYIDFNIINMEEELLEIENFRDDAHLNDSGVKIVNEYFVEWLKNNTNYFGNNN